MRILYLDLDTLRPDHLGCYGYHRNTSPNIDRVASEGTVFSNYYCSDAPCLPSRTALTTSRFGIHTGVVGHGGTTADVRLEGEDRGFRSELSKTSLPGFLRSQGFRTVSISPFAERHGTWSFYAGFNEMYNTGNGGMESAEDITPVALKWIDDNADKDNWFLHVNFWDAHTPYRSPEEFGNPFENDPLPEWLTEEVFDKHKNMVGPHKPKEINMFDSNTSPQFPRHPGELRDMKDLRRMIDGYDCGISYMDSHIGKVIDALENKGILDDLIIIISADHAENMGELGIYGEHGTADYDTCRIPMVVRWPGVAEHRFDDGLHYNLDLLPTLADLLGAEPYEIWDGQSYADTLRDGSDCGRDYLVLSQCAHVCQRSVRFGDWIYIRTYHDGYHLFDDEMLYNLKNDPHEQYNIAKDNKDICMQAVYYLNQWHDDMMSTMESDIDPLWTVIREGGPFHAKGRLKNYCERLEATGRDYGVDELKKRHPGEFK